MSKDLTTVRDIVRGDNHSPIWLLAAASLLEQVAAEIRREVAAAPEHASRIAAAKEAGF